jgi:hypothetical protein
MGENSDLATFMMSTPSGPAGHAITILENAGGGYSVIDATNILSASSVDQYMQIVGQHGWVPTSNIVTGINSWAAYSLP